MPEDLAHIPLFAGVAGMLYTFGFVRGSPWRRAAAVAAVSLGLGLLLEVVQYATGTGEAEALDVGYDVIGIAVGLVVAAALSAVSRRIAGAVIGVGAVVGILLAPQPAGAPVFEYDSAATAERCAGDPAPDAPPSASTAPAPVAHYDFDEGTGTVVEDDAGALDVTIGSPDAVSWTGDGGLAFSGRSAEASSDEPAAALAADVTVAGEVSVEAWFTPGPLPQPGPVRLVTVSDGPDFGQVNVHLGIEERSISFRVATDCDFFNWTLSDDVLLEGDLHHVVATYRPGSIVIHLDGEPLVTAAVPVGYLDGWDAGYHLHLGDEATGDRAFEGTLEEVAIFDEALSTAAVRDRFERGPGS
jgi:hypothetical protein